MIPKVRALTRTQAKGNSTTKICSLYTLLSIKTSSLLTGIFSLETDKLKLQRVSCVDYNFSAFYDRSLSS